MYKILFVRQHNVTLTELKGTQGNIDEMSLVTIKGGGELLKFVKQLSKDTSYVNRFYEHK